MSVAAVARVVLLVVALAAATAGCAVPVAGVAVAAPPPPQKRLTGIQPCSVLNPAMMTEFGLVHGPDDDAAQQASDADLRRRFPSTTPYPGCLWSPKANATDANRVAVDFFDKPVSESRDLWTNETTLSQDVDIPSVAGYEVYAHRVSAAKDRCYVVVGIADAEALQVSAVDPDKTCATTRAIAKRAIETLPNA